MFTGIIEELGEVVGLDNQGTHARLVIHSPMVVSDAAIGDSIAVNGCCLTVEEHVRDADGTLVGWAADLIDTTMSTTSLGGLTVGATVNLERAMASGQRFGGHMVQGHVDGVGEIVGREEQPGTVFLTVRAPDHLLRYLVDKGSVTMEGTSLTVASVDGDTFRVGLIPHTLEVTVFGTRGVGDRVNLEVDVIAKYVERLLAAGVQTPYSPS